MLSIRQKDIVMAQQADNKQQAITAIAKGLIAQGYVAEGYIEGMLARERQSSTFLGSGIAIPHGTTDTRDQVKQTGVLLHHFPDGVDWGDGNTVYLAIGIAAQSDQHLAILKQLTKVLSADGVEAALQQAKDESALVQLLSGQQQLQTHVEVDLIKLKFNAADLLQLSAVAAGLLKNKHYVDKAFVAEVITNEPTYLGQGLWLSSAKAGVAETAISFVTPQAPLIEAEKPLLGLLCIASCNDLHANNLSLLIKLIASRSLESLLNGSESEIIQLLTQAPAKGISETFTVKNPHGLHARPGALLVSVAKKFNATIQITNLDSEGKSANAKSLMKLMTLGVKCGHRLTFTADGDDAEAALAALGEAIEQGLGESMHEH
ncbi:fused PTS fructose transporter subunit IIA/HPr protein [Motilimonas cestriensis]|uniref:fused PTS fructose transporter subunit IIA/HPr protein n=1 Tax=Motilimonas cestriensis TaxID=2742685 RepID=UPI003DA5A7A6